VSDISETFNQTARALPRTGTTAWSKAGANAETAWRRWATRHRAAAAMLGGLVGVHVASLFGFWFGGFGLDRLDFNTANGAVYLPQATHIQQFLVGGLSHYTDGVFFGLIFAVAAWPLLPLPATRLGNLAKAMIFSTVLALLAAFVVLPLAFGPLYGRHNDLLLAFHLGWKYAFSILLLHWIYGAQLGLIYNPLDEDQLAD
jgi:hypothetical protein